MIQKIKAIINVPSRGIIKMFLIPLKDFGNQFKA